VTRDDNLELIKLLVSHGADVNAVDLNGETPLFWVIDYSGVPTVTRLPSIQLKFELENKEHIGS
jgi:ankyrin repeat protein